MHGAITCYCLLGIQQTHKQGTSQATDKQPYTNNHHIVLRYKAATPAKVLLGRFKAT